MMKTFFASIIIALTVVSGFSQTTKQLKAYIDHKVYADTKSAAFVEVHMQFVGYSINYKKTETGLQGAVAIKLNVLNLKGDTIYKDAYALNSPIMRDSLIEDFFDVLRFPLPVGEFTASVSLIDLNAVTPPVEGKIEISIPDFLLKQHISDVLIAEVAYKTQEQTVFSKSGYDIIPRISNFFPEELSHLPYYIEIYNTHLLGDSLFGLKQRVVNTETKKEVDVFSRLSKLKSDTVVPLLRKLDLSQLPSGSYMLELSVVDRFNTQRGEEVFYYFERVNKDELNFDPNLVILDPAFDASVTDDSLSFYISSLLPIARQAEAKSILSLAKKGSIEEKRNYFRQFWSVTAGSDAYNQWLLYKQNVQMVQRLYKNNFQDGFETDRGRVFLQYGPPSTVQEYETSPTEYPYEIWHYYKIKKFSNKRFIFYNPDLVKNTHRLLHSDMYGEIQNYRWQQALSKRNSSNSNIDDPNDGNKSHYGGNSNEHIQKF